jgi:hypothetical protein
VDEIPSAPVDGRAIIVAPLIERRHGRKRTPSFHRVFAQSPQIIVHHSTSKYIERNEVEQRLGTNIEVFAGNNTLTLS